MEDELNVGDRVYKCGFKFLHEDDKFGTVIRVYNGIMAAGGTRHEFLEIEWDNGETDRGYLRRIGHIQRAPTVIAADTV